MSPELRAGAMLGRRVQDAGGATWAGSRTWRPGATRTAGSGSSRWSSSAGRWGRLLGYERDEVVGPWLLEWFARLVILRRDLRRIPWDDAKPSLAPLLAPPEAT